MGQFAISPEGTTETSPGQQSWVRYWGYDQSRQGRLSMSKRLGSPAVTLGVAIGAAPNV